VKDFNSKLKNEKFKTCIIDTEKNSNSCETSGNKSNKNIIRQSECFICFLSKKYLDNEENRNELKYASDNRKKIFLVKLDNIKSFEEAHSDLTTVVPFACFNFYYEYASIRNTINLLTKSIKDSLKTLNSISEANSSHTKIYKNGRYEGELVVVNYFDKLKIV